jgi:hypothetical protein
MGQKVQNIYKTTELVMNKKYQTEWREELAMGHQ